MKSKGKLLLHFGLKCFQSKIWDIPGILFRQNQNTSWVWHHYCYYILDGMFIIWHIILLARPHKNPLPCFRLGINLSVQKKCANTFLHWKYTQSWKTNTRKSTWLDIRSPGFSYWLLLPNNYTALSKLFNFSELFVYNKTGNPCLSNRVINC